MKEKWKDIYGFEGYYQISNHGRIRSLNRVIIEYTGRKKTYKGILMRLQVHTKGYLHILLRKEGERYKFFVHRLVAQTFLENPEEKLYVNHKDKDRQNNHWLNLEWCTIEENTEHRDNYNPDEPF